MGRRIKKDMPNLAERMLADYTELANNFRNLIEDYQVLTELFLELVNYNKIIIDNIHQDNPDISLRMLNKLNNIVSRYSSETAPHSGINK